METKKFKLGLVPKLIIAIILGILIGQFMPEPVCRLVVTLSGFFSNFLKFVIPLMILAYVTMGIADLTQGAGKLLLITVAIAYCSTLIAGSASYLVSSSLFPSFMSADAMAQIAATAGISLAPYFSISIPPILDTLSAVVLAFILGLCLSTMRGKEIGDTLYNGVKDFSAIIDKVLGNIIIPLLPLYICGTFTDMTKSGKTFAILSILWKVFIVVILMHLICIVIQFTIAGVVSKKSPFAMIKKQIPGYTTALGTQSSAATIPVNLKCAESMGVCEQIRNFVVPLCANIHMAGSMITITACATAVCLMNQLPISLGTVVPFIMTLGIAMVASPGTPGGSIMTALPFLYMVFGAEAGDPNISNILKIIIQTKQLGEVCGIGYSTVDALDDLKYIKPDIIVVDLLMPDMDGITFVRQLSPELPDSAFIMLSQVSDKEMIASAYESGVEFFVQKPINAIEVESVLTKVIRSLSMKRTLSGMQNLLRDHMQELSPKVVEKTEKEPVHLQKAKDILQHLGIIGEIGSRDILLAVDYMISNPELSADKKLSDLCAHFCDNPKSAEQRIRRTVNVAMSNLAHLGLEDYSNDTFVEYSNTLFNFEQVRREMDYIRGRSIKRGNVKIRNFLNALVSYCGK